MSSSTSADEPLGSITAPLTFADFLQKMRHPSAADLVKAIKSFIGSFGLANDITVSPPGSLAEAEADSRRVQQFYVATEATFANHPLWKKSAAAELENAGEGLEKYVMTKLYPRTFALAREDAVRNEYLAKRMKIFQFVRLEHLDIPPRFWNQANLRLAMNELAKMNQFRAPREKLLCILNCCKVVTSILNSSSDEHAPAGADDFLPMLIYVVIHACPPDLYANLEFIKRYRAEKRLVSEPAYYYTNMISAASFIEQADASSFTMDPDEFETLFQKNQVLVSEQQSKQEDKTSPDATDDGPQTEYSEQNQQPSVENTNRTEAELRIPDAPTRVDLEVPSMEDLQNVGQVVLTSAGETQMFARYKYLFANSDDLLLTDIPMLLQDYKELVLSFESLRTGIENFTIEVNHQRDAINEKLEAQHQFLQRWREEQMRKDREPQGTRAMSKDDSSNANSIKPLHEGETNGAVQREISNNLSQTPNIFQNDPSQSIEPVSSQAEQPDDENENEGEEVTSEFAQPLVDPALAPSTDSNGVGDAHHEPATNNNYEPNFEQPPLPAFEASEANGAEQQPENVAEADILISTEDAVAEDPTTSPSPPLLATKMLEDFGSPDSSLAAAEPDGVVPAAADIAGSEGTAVSTASSSQSLLDI